MSATLVLFEDALWPRLRPLTDLTAVPALAFGASNLATRWRGVAGVPLLAIAARRDVLQGDAIESLVDPMAPAPDDVIWAINAAALPGAWFERLRTAKAPVLLMAGDRVVAASLPYRALQPGLGGDDLGAFLAGLGLSIETADARVVLHPWDLIAWNAEAIAGDLAALPGAIAGDVHPQASVLEPSRVIVERGARVDPFAVLDARHGPIRLEAGVIVLSHTVVVGPCAVGAGTQLLGGFVGRSTFGPECRIAGEVEECVWQGYGNKRHHGFVGHSAIGEWVNLGALTTTSDLKNNYGHVRVWVGHEEVDSQSSKVGSIVGPHVKTGIGTLLPTGASIGTGSNLFGGGRFTPKKVPAFAWWDGERAVEHQWEPFLATARIAVSRRNRTLGPAAEKALRALFEHTAGERAHR